MNLSGDWTVYNASAIENEIDAVQAKSKISSLIINAEKISKIDTAGAWLIKKHFAQQAHSIRITPQQEALLDFLPAELKAVPKRPTHSGAFQFFYKIGAFVTLGLEFIYALLVFIGKIFTRFLFNFTRPRHFRFPSIVRHIYETGVQAIPIVALLAFLMSMVISYQAAIQLQKFGADIFTIDLMVISLLREMGVLVTAIMVAGRSGSAFAAEIGVMKLREEVDALRTIGMDPIEVLVLPRLIALIIVLPLLTLIADLVGLAGGGVMSVVLLDVSLAQYIDRAQNVATYTMFFVGMIKAPVFAFLIAVIGTYQGMNVSGSAESVGHLTTVAVVQSIFLVIMTDGLFSIIFAIMGI
ncbi:MAG: MlaE family lipid ABC transporter permease subunit [Micavibrio sp.]